MRSLIILIFAALLLVVCSGKNEGTQDGKPMSTVKKSKGKSGKMKFRFPEIQSPQEGAVVDREFEVTLRLPDKNRGGKSRWWLAVERNSVVWPLFKLTTVEKMHTVKVKERCSYRKEGPFNLFIYLEIMGPDKFDEYLEKEKQGNCAGLKHTGGSLKEIIGYTHKGSIMNLRYK